MKLLHHNMIKTHHVRTTLQDNEETTKPNKVTTTHNEEARQHNVVTTTHDDETTQNNDKKPHKKDMAFHTSTSAFPKVFTDFICVMTYKYYSDR